MTAVDTTLRRGPDPDRFRTDHDRSRWYCDPLPADDIAPATDDIWPSVTTIKKAWSKPFRKKLPDGSRAVPLDAYQAAEWVVNNLPAVNALKDDPDAAMSLICDAPGRSLNRASKRGGAVHEIMETLAAGREIDELLTPSAARPFVKACSEFVADWSPRFVYAEVVAINRTLGFGGTFDGYAVIETPHGRRWYVDYKSRGGKNGCYEEEVAQLGGYSLAEYIVLVDDDGAAFREPAPDVDGVMIVSLNADGYEAYPIDLDKARAAFKAMLVSWREQRDGQKAARAARGKPMFPARKAPAAEAPTEATGVQGDAGEGAASTVTDAPSPASGATGEAEAWERPASPERVAWLRGRVKVIYDAGHGADLDSRWLIDVCPIPMRDYTDEQVSRATMWLDEVETMHEVPIGPPDPLFAVFMEQAPPVEEAPPPEPVNPLDDARHWRDKAKAELLAEFDHPDVLAIAAAAGMTPEDSRMNERRYLNIEAIVGELADGAVMFAYDDADGAPQVVPVSDAALRMEAACAGPDGKSLGKTAALTRAKAWAKHLGLPTPRGLNKAAESPLLAALVASGREVPTPTTNESEST